MLRHRRCQSAPPALSLDKAPPQPGHFRAARPLTGAVTVSTAACVRPPRPSTPPRRTPAAAAAAPAPRTPSPAPHLKASSYMSPPPAPKKQRVGLDDRRGEARKRKMHESSTEEGGRARKRRILSSMAGEEMEGECLAQEEEEEEGEEDGSVFGGESPEVAEVLERRFRLIVEQEEGSEEK